MYKYKFTEELDPTHFHCVRYIGPPLKSNFDKTSVYYKFADSFGMTVTVTPLAFTWTEEGSEAVLVLPLWMKKMGDFGTALGFEKISEVLEFDGTLKLEWLFNLKPSSSALEEILPHLFGERRPLCNGTVLPFIFGGQRYFLRIKSSFEDGKIFWFNLETGSLDVKNEKKCGTYSDVIEILKNGSWQDEIKVLKYQLKNENSFKKEEKVLFLICGVPLPLQREFIDLLEVESEPIEVEVPEEHLQVDFDSSDDSSSDDDISIFYTYKFLEEVENISPNLMTEILKKLSNRVRVIFLTSANSIESSKNLLQLEKSAHRFNFQVLNFCLPVISDGERLEILKEAINENVTSFKNYKNLNFCDLMRVKRILKSGKSLVFALNCVKSTENNSTILTIPSSTNISFFGYEKILKEIENMIKGPLIIPEAYERFGLPKSSGFLIHGPSGCGKTSLCLKILTKFNQNFTIFHVPSASQLLSKYFGETEANIRKLFSQARERKPSIIFIDQIETLGLKRGLDSSSTNGSNERYLSTLLNEMDGISGNEGVSILACANHIEMLDEALLRPGRLDRHFYLGLPDEQDRREIIKGFKDTKNFDIEEIVKETNGLTTAEIKFIIKKL